MRVVIACCFALAALSLLRSSVPGADPWAWLIWGREIVHLNLDTTGGPSWKPLPVIVTTPLPLLGDAAPALWLVVARAGGLLAMATAYRLAAGLARPAPLAWRRTAGVVAVVAIALMPGWLRFMAHGTSEPLVAALVLLAIERHLAGREEHAFALAFAVSLARPEAWPFFGLYGLWLGWSRPERRVLVGALFVAVPVLWFVPDWLGSGSPFYGGKRARSGTSGIGLTGQTTIDALHAAWRTVAAPVLAAAVAFGVAAWRRRDHTRTALAAGAFAWLGLVVAMTAIGYPGLGRLMIPPAALICVIAGAGVALLAGLEAPGRVRIAAAVPAIAIALPFAVSRALDLDGQVADRGDAQRLNGDLPEAIDAGGGRALLAGCKSLWVGGTPKHPGMDRPLAWRLHVPLHAVKLQQRRRLPDGAVLFSPRDSTPTTVTAVGTSRRWAVTRRGAARCG